MKKETEKFIVRMTRTGMTLQGGDGSRLRFTASEALMLLDILLEERENLEVLARKSSPLPMRFLFQETKAPS
jgi:hypothetical protein